MTEFDLCKRTCASGDQCIMPDDVELAVAGVNASIEDHQPRPIDFTTFGANLGNYCFRMAKYRDTFTEMAPLFQDALASLELPTEV